MRSNARRWRIDWRVALTHREIFERYVYAGPISRDPAAIAAMFTEDGVFEVPLLPDGHPLPRRMVGRDAIRTGITAYLRHPAHEGTVNLERSAYVLHETEDPDVFIVEIDAVFDETSGRSTTLSQVKIFRVRDGRIVSLRDYFTPPPG
jgi:ketosteroid isomerase-like protein